MEQMKGTGQADRMIGNSAEQMMAAGAGNDVMRGRQGDDFMMGGTGDDNMAGQAGNDTMFGAGSLGGTVDMDRFRIAEATTATVTFQGESAGYKNALGMYRIASDGTIHGVDILFANASLKGSGGDLVAGKSSVHVELEAGDRLGFFVVPNGYSQSGMAKLLADEKGSFKLVDASGKAGSVDGGPLKLVHVAPNGVETLIRSQYGSDVFHSTQGSSGKLNADGLQHVTGHVDVASGQVTVGFEDLWKGGDKDFDDSVFTVDIGQTNAALMPRASSGANSETDNDVMAGGAGNDKMFGMSGDDKVSGGAGDDQLWGNSGNDVLRGGTGNDKLHGGSGDDKLLGGAGDDHVEGNSGNDVIKGGAGNDVLYGNSGNDVIHDGAGNDKVDGGSGDDRMVAGAGDDSYNGGSGFDTLDYSASTGAITLHVSKKFANGFGSDTFTSIEAFVGSRFDDNMKGSKNADHLSGGAGDDVIRGMGGADTLTGGRGADTFTWLAKDVMLDGQHLGVDTVTDFSAAQGDVLDFSKMIPGTPGDVTGFVQFAERDGGTMVSVKLGEAFVDVVLLNGVQGLDAADMAKDGLLLA